MSEDLADSVVDRIVWRIPRYDEVKRTCSVVWGMNLT
jgi:hypothetical protein